MTGADLSPDAIELARSLATELGFYDAQFVRSNIYDLPAALDGEFDVVTCMELLEHVPEPAAMVAACARLVRAGGQVFFSTINRNPRSYLFAVIGAEYLLRLLPRGTHDYLRFVKPSELSRWSRASGLRPDELVGMSYNPVTRRYRLGADCGVNYLLYCVRDD